MNQPHNHFVHVRGAKLRYVDWGDNGPPLLLVHGDLRTSRSWDAFARDIADRYHVIALDMRGHGDSDWTPRGYRFAERMEDMAAFCKSIGLRDAIGVGHSTGGVVMAMCAQKYPHLFSRLVLMEPMVVVNEQFQKMVSGRADAPRTTWESKEELHEYLTRHPAVKTWREDVIRDVVEHEAYQRDDGLFDMKWSPYTFNWPDRDGDFVDLKPIFKELGISILFIRSTNHKSRNEEQHVAPDDIPDFRKLTIENAGHNMYMERPDAVARAINAFVDGKELPETL